MFFIQKGMVNVHLTTYSNKQIDETGFKQGPKSVKQKKKKKYLLFEGGEEEEKKDEQVKEFSVTQYLETLKVGDYFGEISLITNLKRTTTIKAADEQFSTIAYIQREKFEEIKTEFPQVYYNIKKEIFKYKDSDFMF